MATYYFAAAFQTSDAMSDDGTHRDAQYGFGVDSGSGPSALGDSGPQARTFESVSIPAASGNQQNQLVVTLFSDLIGINQSRSFARVSFRPAHDVTPANNLPLAPIVQNNAQALLTGFTLGDRQNVSQQTQVTNGTKFGLDKDSYATQWLFPAYSFINGQQGTSVHFEIAIEIAIVENGSNNWMYFKVDPEMQIDF